MNEVLSVVTWNMQQYDHMLINIHRLMFLVTGSIQELTCLLLCYCAEVIHAEPANLSIEIMSLILLHLKQNG